MRTGSEAKLLRPFRVIVSRQTNAVGDLVLKSVCIVLAVLSLSAAPAAADPPSSAQAFASRIVARLNTGNARFSVPETAAWYDPVFLRLFHDNLTLAAAHHTETLMDTNPVCGCTDAGSVYRLVSVTPRPGGMAWARVGARYETQDHEYVIVLSPARQAGGGWRIHDVIDGGHSIRGFLTTHVACLRAARTQSAADLCSAP
jgi:hypothetical protein